MCKLFNETRYLISNCVYACANKKIKGTEVEGIFRLSPSFIVLTELVELVNQGQDFNFEEPIILKSSPNNESGLIDPNLVAGLIKKYFRELQEPLCPEEMYDMWLAAISIKDKPTLLKQVKKVFEFLPLVNQEVIIYLVSFLRYMVKFSSTTKMSAASLSICFAPNLLRAPEGIQLFEQIQDSPFANLLLETLINDFHLIFLTEKLTQSLKLESKQIQFESHDYQNKSSNALDTPPKPKPKPKPKILSTQFSNILDTPPKPKISPPEIAPKPQKFLPK